MRAAHATTIFLHQSADDDGQAQEDHDDQDALTVAPQDFCKEARDRCVAFFKTTFLRSHEHLARSRRIDKPSHLLGTHFLPVTRFHVALLHNNVAFVEDVLEGLTAPEAKHVLTALVENRLAHPALKLSVISDVMEESPNLTEEEARRKEIGMEAIAEWEKSNEKHLGLCFQLPLSMAACGGSSDLMRLVLEKGGDLLQTDSYGNNIVHLLVEMSGRHPKRAVKMYKAILDLARDQLTKQKLLSAENLKGLTPLYSATYQCLPEMMHAIMNTEGIFKFLIKDLGTHSHSLYDVTQDEMYSVRKGQALLQHLSVVTEKQLARLDKFRFLEKEPFSSWLKVKERANLKRCQCWMALWVIYVILCVISVIWLGERGSSPPAGYNIAVLLYSVVFAVMEIKAFQLNAPYLKMFQKYENSSLRVSLINEELFERNTLLVKNCQELVPGSSHSKPTLVIHLGARLRLPLSNSIVAPMAM